MLGLGEIFILFFVMLGPLKLLGPYCQQTQDLDAGALRVMALRVFVTALGVVIVGGYVGSVLANKWRISIPAIEIAAGIIFFLVALQLVMAPYGSAAGPAPPLPVSPLAAANRLAFPLVVTPYGIAVLIALLVSHQAPAGAVLGLLILVMVLDLLAMLYIRQIMRGFMLLTLQLVGAVLGVLQVALAVQILIRGLRDLHVMSP